MRALARSLLTLIAATALTATLSTPTTAAQPSTTPLTDLSSAFERVAETIAPSVVTIRSVKEVEASPMPRLFFGDSPLGDMFGEQFFERFEQTPSRPYLQQGQGSGVIVSADGYILTNSHVVAEADEVTVILTNDRRYTAEVVGADARSDLAVVKIDAGGLVPAKLGDSDDLSVGQWVVAAGNPFGLSSTITVGIVSAKGRSRVGIADYEDFIQTDAAINPGNSGGPLVNLQGEVVGINTAIFTRSGGSSGIGFAIPIDMARSIMNDLIDSGQVVRGYLGVLIQDLSEGMARSFGYEGTDGALIGQVTDDGPAGEAGLRAGDIITHFDGERVTGVDRLRLTVSQTDPGRSMPVRVFRDGETRTMMVTIGELPTEAAAPLPAESSDLNVGMTIETLTPALARRLGADPAVSGVVVTGVEPLGPAARAGLQPRDLITHVHDEPVADAAEFRRELRKHDLNEGVRLVVEGDGSRRFVFLQLRD